jgi:hypothetical protein
MKTVLICHEEAIFDREGLARWMGSFSDLVGLVVLRETAERKRKRIRREIERVGRLRFADVLAFRAYYMARLAAADAAWERGVLADMARRFPALPRACRCSSRRVRTRPRRRRSSPGSRPT